MRLGISRSFSLDHSLRSFRVRQAKEAAYRRSTRSVRKPGDIYLVKRSQSLTCYTIQQIALSSGEISKQSAVVADLTVNLAGLRGVLWHRFGLGGGCGEREPDVR